MTVRADEDETKVINKTAIILHMHACTAMDSVNYVGLL